MRRDILIIQKALSRNRNIKLTFGLTLLLGSIYFIFTATNSGLPDKSAFAVSVILLLISFTGFYFVLHALLRFDAQKNYLLSMLEKYPNEVAWVYYVKVETFPFGIRFMQFSTLHIMLSNREHISIQMKENEILSLIRLLREHAPQATFGYSTFKEQLYNINPDLLINDNQSEFEHEEKGGVDND